NQDRTGPPAVLERVGSYRSATVVKALMQNEAGNGAAEGSQGAWRRRRVEASAAAQASGRGEAEAADAPGGRGGGGGGVEASGRFSMSAFHAQGGRGVRWDWE
ncbi:hypothetical protein L249_1604, partial [Ophiocordyceps polyrhachis-furcata BCC 54312]